MAKQITGNLGDYYERKEAALAGKRALMATWERMIGAGKVSRDMKYLRTLADKMRQLRKVVAE